MYKTKTVIDRIPVRYYNEQQRYLFSKTDNNNLPIVYEPQSLGVPYLINYKVDWREGDPDALIRHFSFWEESLIKFGKMYNELEDKATREALLTADEIALWNICEANYQISFSIIKETAF